MGGEELKSFFWWILFDSFSRCAELRNRFLREVFPSPPNPLLPRNSE